MTGLGRRIGGDPRLAVLSAVVANGIPVLGVVALGWSAPSMLVVFTVGILITWVGFGLKALFAARPVDNDEATFRVQMLPARRGGIDLPVGPKLRIQNLPPVSSRLFLLFYGWIPVALAVSFGIASAGIGTSPGAMVETAVNDSVGFLELFGLYPTTIAIGLFSLVLGQIVSVTRFVSSDRYQEVSADDVLSQYTAYFLFYFAIMLAGSLDPLVGVAAFALFGIAIEVYEIRQSGSDGRDSTEADYPFQDQFPGGDPVETFQGGDSPPGGTAAGGTLMMMGGGLFPAAVAMGAGAYALESDTLVLGCAVGTLLLSWAFAFWLSSLATRGTEYHVYDDALVVHDSFLGAQQTVLPYDELTEVTVEGKAVEVTADVPDQFVGNSLGTQLSLSAQSAENAEAIRRKIESRKAASKSPTTGQDLAT